MRQWFDDHTTDHQWSLSLSSVLQLQVYSPLLISAVVPADPADSSSAKKKSLLNTRLRQFLMVTLFCCRSFPSAWCRFTAQFRVPWSVSSCRPSTDTTRIVTVKRDEKVLLENVVLSAERHTLPGPCRGRMCSHWSLSWQRRTSSGKTTGGVRVCEFSSKLLGEVVNFINRPRQTAGHKVGCRYCLSAKWIKAVSFLICEEKVFNNDAWK